MDALSWLGLEPTADPLAWRLPVSTGVCSGYGQLFGGCGLAAAVVALEQVTSRRAIWATAQYLRYAQQGTTLDLEVTVPVTGHNISQGRVIARNADQEILTVNAALGDRPGTEVLALATFPDVPPPEDCEPRATSGGGPAGGAPGRPSPASPSEGGGPSPGVLDGRLEVRLARGRPRTTPDGVAGDGRVCLWARVTGALEPSAAWLAVIGDLVPAGVANARGVTGGGNSLDNTLRVLRLVPSDWILCDIGIDGMARGFAHGWGHLWAQDGTMMGTASQSVIVRSRRDRRIGLAQAHR